jgi:nicotinate-nucleotide--dimethylbenzimidazole phosphoribosyltransferase
VFCRQNGLGLRVVDAGVDFSFAADLPIVHAKVARGTRSFLDGPAMTHEQLIEGVRRGSRLIDEWAAEFAADEQPTVVGFGEMGIGNTSAAALLMHLGTGIPLAECVGRGTGLDDAGLARKRATLAAALQAAHQAGLADDPLAQTAWFGGFEIALMIGGMLAAAARRQVILVDGFIATAAFLTARRLAPAINDFAVFCHQSDEGGHRALLEHLGAQPLLRLGLRLGEGTGCALAFPLLTSAVAFLTEMASFEAAGVSTATS